MRTANYLSVITGRLAAKLPGCPTDLLRMYALLVLTTGTETTLENVHDAWSTWRDATRPDHPSLVPFAELAPDVQELDRKYADAIREVAERHNAEGQVSS